MSRHPIFPLTRDLACSMNDAASVGETLHDQYASAEPFPHIVMDDFLEPSLLEQVLSDIAELPAPEGSFDRPQERLKTSYAPDVLPQYTRSLFWFFNSRPFISFLEKLTGISGLIGDPYYLGGGIHRVGNGGHLDIHADFNYMKKLNLERRLNVLLYLNKEWAADFGGQFEIWDRKMASRLKSVEPLYNRCVVFNTDSHSYHGNPNPVNHPEGRSRLSIALYYYTATWDPTRREHTTHFKVRPATADQTDWNVAVQEAIEQVTPPIVLRGMRRALRGVSKLRT